MLFSRRIMQVTFHTEKDCFNSFRIASIIGDKIYGIAGDLIDLVAVFSTLFGITVSLGLGASQMSSGIEYLFGTTITPMFKLSVVLVVSIIATVSVVSGLKEE